MEDDVEANHARANVPGAIPKPAYAAASPTPKENVYASESSLNHSQPAIDQFGENETLIQIRAEYERHHETLQKVKRWKADVDRRGGSFLSKCAVRIGVSPAPEGLTSAELKSLVHYFFPPRSEIKVTICDISSQALEIREKTLKSLVLDGLPFDANLWAVTLTKT